MAILFRLAVTAAAATSAIALYDAAHHGFTGQYSEFSEASNLPAVILIGEIIHGLNYAALAVVLLLESKSAGASRLQRVVARLLSLNLGMLAVLHLMVRPITAATGEGPEAFQNALSAIGGSAFLLMFLLAFVLGLTLLRRPDRRFSAVTLVAIAPVILLTVVGGILGSRFTHPAYAETLVYLGIALLALPTAIARSDHARAVQSSSATA